MRITASALFACCIAGLTLAACSHTPSSPAYSGQIIGSGTFAEQKRPIEEVETLVLDGPVGVVLTQGEPGLAVKGDDNLVDFVTAESADGVLTISVEASYSPRQELVAHVTLPSLARIENASSGDITVEGWAAEALVAESSSSGDIRFEGALGTLVAVASGSGDVDFSNSAAGSVDAQASGSGDLALGPVGNLDARLSGSGDIIAAQVGNLVAQSSGSGDILYLSAKNVDIVSHTGSGEIRKR